MGIAGRDVAGLPHHFRTRLFAQVGILDYPGVGGSSQPAVSLRGGLGYKAAPVEIHLIGWRSAAESQRDRAVIPSIALDIGMGIAGGNVGWNGNGTFA